MVVRIKTDSRPVMIFTVSDFIAYLSALRIRCCVKDVDGLRRNYRRDSVFINNILVACTVKHDNIAVKPSYHALELEAVHKDEGRKYLFFSDLVQENVLKIYVFIHLFVLRSFLHKDTYYQIIL